MAPAARSISHHECNVAFEVPRSLTSRLIKGYKATSQYDPMKRRGLPYFACAGILAAFLLSSFSAGFAAEPSSVSRPNQLSDGEKAAGWRLLFDGKTTKGWRNFKKLTFPEKGWVVEEGCLKHIANGGGGDIITVDQFDDFELQWEWRIPAGANNGVKYFITEQRASAVGHEYQMIDDVLVKDALGSTASFYEVLAPKADKPLKPPGQWNHSKILVRGNHVEHWLNGARVLEYELGSDQVKIGVAKSKFKNVEGFGTKIKGHVLLTEHHDEASFRSIKIRELSGK